MQKQKEKIENLVWETLLSLAAEKEINLEDSKKGFAAEVPPNSDMGDLAFPMFPFAKAFRMGPPQIATELKNRISDATIEKVVVTGPYLNIFFSRGILISETIKSALAKKEDYLSGNSLKQEKVMIEFSCPNTNKPLHLGHLRNDAIGESMARIFTANGADVTKVNLINDRGIHICKSMIAYKEFGNGATPESTNRKSDHFVGDYYIEYNKREKEDPSIEDRARQMLLDWENEDPETLKLWKQMNKWAIDGVNKTYEDTGVSFDKVYFEHQTYLLGKDIILKGLEKGLFKKDEENRVILDLEEIGLDKKVLLRGDGTSVYMTQDIGTAISRHNDIPFNRMIYVVASEQSYHFKVLFFTLKKLGYKWAENLSHLAYGMVHLPEGRMKSREGTVVDADNLLAELASMAKKEIENKERPEDLKNVDKTSKDVALAALHYYLLQTSPYKDMIFNPKDSLSFNGNTGPYLQYVTSRISSMMRKAETRGIERSYTDVDFTLLSEPVEWEIIKILADFPQKLEQAASDLSPSIIAGNLYQLAKEFSRFYHDCPILGCDDKELSKARLALSESVLIVLKRGFYLINIPFLEKM